MKKKPGKFWVRGRCNRCGGVIAESFPVHVCHVDGEPDQDGLGNVLDATNANT